MKQILIIIVAAMMFSCSGNKTFTIVVGNSLDFNRNGEMVEIERSQLKADFSTKTYVLTDDKGIEIPYQLVDNGNEPLIIFQASVPAMSSAVYTLSEGTPSTVTPRTRARLVPERKDDFSWENDLAGYRMYGPALAPENPSNGVDLWLKCTDELITDKFYADELERGITYHENNGLGLDCYDVKHTAGAGGIAPYTTKLWTGDNFNDFEISESGPLRSVFTLIYDSVKVEDSYYQEIITITSDAGSPLNKAVVCYIGEDVPMQLAAGINLHEVRGLTFQDADLKVMGYAEDAVSAKKIPQGRSYVGVYMPDAVGYAVEEENHYLIKAEYQAGSWLTYYFGGGWSQWKYSSDKDWFNALMQFARAKTSPLKVTIQ